MAKQRIHWVSFDPSQARDRQAFQRGTGFTVERVYLHPSKMWLSVAKLLSASDYQNLDLDVNSGSTSIRYHDHKPAGLSAGLPLEKFEAIYGKFSPAN